MSADVIQFKPMTAEEAWNDFRAHAARRQTDPSLELNREYMTRFAQLYDRFYRITTQERG